MSDYTPQHAADAGLEPIEDQAPPALVFSNATYEVLRAFVEVILPGVSTLYLALATIWNLPGGDKVAGTIAAVSVFLGLIVRLARRSFNKSDAKYDGVIEVTDEEGLKKADLILKNYENPADVVAQKEVLFKVNEL